MISNRQLILPYAAPYMAYVFVASALTEIPVEINYALRIGLVIALLFWAKKWYFSITGPKTIYSSILTGIIGGLIGFALWVALLLPFTDGGEAPSWSVLAFILRICAAGLLVPIFEELLMRGYIYRLAWQWQEARRQGEEQPLPTVLDEHSINEVPPGAWSWTAIIISTLVFTMGHHFHEWPASIAYGLLMAALWVWQKDLLVCIVAHAVTNTILALYVITTGSWQLW